MKIKYIFITSAIFLSQTIFAQRQMEYLKRGIVAIPSESGVFVSWRLLGTEEQNAKFDVYRTEYRTKGAYTKKLNKEPLLEGTNFLDKTAKKGKDYTYFIQSYGEDLTVNYDYAKYSANQKPYFSIPLKTP